MQICLPELSVKIGNCEEQAAGGSELNPVSEIRLVASDAADRCPTNQSASIFRDRANYSNSFPFNSYASVPLSCEWTLNTSN